MLHIEIVNDKRIVQSLQKAAAQLAATGPLMQQVGGVLESNARERFDSKSDPAGGKWPDISPATAAIHRAIHGKALGGSLMERSGGLRDSIEAHVIDAGTGVEVGTSKTVKNKNGKTWHLGGLHEFGTARMVRRGILFGAVTGQGQGAQVSRALSRSDTQDVLAAIQRHIEQATDGLG